MSAIFEIAHEPIDRVAMRVARDRAFDDATEQDIDELIVILMNRQGEVKLTLAGVDAAIREASERYHAYGITSAAGWYRAQKIEQERLKQESKRLGNAIDCLRRKAGAKRLGRLGDAFIAAARDVLPEGTFQELLRRAEVAAVVAVRNLGMPE